MTPEQPRTGDRRPPAISFSLAREVARKQGLPGLPLALVATVAIHSGMLLLAPARLWEERTAGAEERPVRVELVEPESEPEEEFVVTNPEAPANPPDETRFFADRDQQAAQPDPDEEGDAQQPDVTGELPEPSQNIVEGEDQMRQPEEEEEAWEEAAPLPRQRPLEGFEAVEEETGIDLPVTLESEEADDDFEIGVPVDQPWQEEEPRPEEEAGESQPEEKRRPRPRPVLPQTSRAAAGLREGAASRVGRVAIDANFQEFGDYLTRMLEVIGRQWHNLAWESLSSSEVGTMVIVSFRIDAAGEVRDLVVDHTSASLTATLICQDAVASRQPYGSWTRDMQEVLGEEQTVRVRFYYR